MRYEFLKSVLRTAAITLPALIAGGVATAQTVITATAGTPVALTATRMTATLPDGDTVPMWGFCTPTLPAGAPGSPCPTATNGTGAWAPAPTIVVPTTSAGVGSLTIALTNTLKAPTSIVILGQLGGGLGTGGTGNDVPRVASPVHNGQAAITWPAVNKAAAFSPPAQRDRAVAFGPEAAAATTTGPGTKTYTWSNLRPGTYLYETGSVPSLQVPMGLYGVLIVTQAPTATAPGAAYPTSTTNPIPYDADAALLFSEIDPRQNAAVDLAATDGASVFTLFNDSSCLSATKTTGIHCYPPAVNYAPTYFMINGHAFDPSAPQRSGFALSGNNVLTGGGQVLLRLLNAGSRTHVPTIVGLQSPLKIVAEDGNLAPGVAKAQSHILLTAGKTFDVVVSPPQVAAVPPATTATYAVASYPIFDRALSLTSGNLDKHTVVANSGMLGFIAVQPAGATIGSAATGGAAVPAALTATALPDTFATPVATALKGNVLSNDVNVVTAALGATTPAHGTVTVNPDGSFIYTPTAGYTGADSFSYIGNGNAAVTALVSITVGATGGAPTAVADTVAAAFTSKVASRFVSAAPGVLANDADPSNLALTAILDSIGASCSSVTLRPDGGFTAVPATVGTPCTFNYHAVNSLGAKSSSVAATVNFPAGSGLAVTVQDTQDLTLPALTDYSWVIEEDTTFFHDPKNPAATNTLATNFHKSFMPLVAAGCTGAASCGDSQLVGGAATPKHTYTSPSDVVLDPAKRYFISILPGDADQGSASYNSDGTFTVKSFGHSMGGSPIAAGQPAVTVLVPRNPLPPAQLSVVVFEDNNPTNGGVDDNEPGLGGFTINIFDTRGSSGDPAGQMTYDLSGMPLTNSLANQKDSVTGVNLCPITGPSGTIITCPAKDGAGQPSPLAGMANIKNFIPGRFDVWAHPGVERTAAGEKWIQVSTLEGTHANDTFVKAGEPSYWQEFGPPGFHSFIGFINPAHIAAVTKAQKGTATVTGRVPSLHMDRPRPTMANLNNSCATGVNANGSAVDPTDPSCRATLAATTCYVAVNSSSGTGATVAMATCDPQGNFSIANVPEGEHELVIWDQWLDQIIAYKALTVPHLAKTVVAGDIPVFSWFTSVQQSAFIDVNQNGVRDPGEPGESQVPMNIRFRDGSIASFLTTDSTGGVTAGELFPLFNWYVLESDTTRYAGTGVSVAYDAGGHPDVAPTAITDLKGNKVAKDYRGLLNSNEPYPLPANLQVPGATYTANSTLRVDPGTTLTEGVQSFINQTSVVDWGKRSYVAGETGGIMGLVFYAATRGFDDPSLEVQFSWEPAVARVPVNLYRETTNPDGSVSRTLVDQTTTWSWDDATAAMHCPGEPAYDATGATGDPFVNVTLGKDAGAAASTKCYDGQHSFNQVQPAVYDGRYRFPTANCTICTPNPANLAANNPNKPASVTYPNVLPAGKYVVELVVPAGYEIVKEEDKNILIGDSWIAPSAATQFMGVGNIFIVPDQATLNDANVTGSNVRRSFPACVGPLHRVPDFLSIFPDAQQVSPFAGQDRPLCDHKEVVLADQMQTSADFQLFTPTPIAAHISGIMLNDAAAEFDPYNPAFLEKASLPNAPISIRDYNGVEIQRVYNDRWGTFNNLVPSSWQANVPDPSGYGSNMLTYCMNDPGPIADPSGQIDASTGKVRLITDPSYNPMFSNFCYNWPANPGITTYLDTPVLPVSAYASASSYEPVDCAYPANTPAIYRVDGTGTFNNSTKTNIGPFVDLAPTSTKTLTITALGDVMVANPAYEGPNAIASTGTGNQPNQPKIKRHYGFGATAGTVSIGGSIIPAANITSWSDLKITLTVPTTATTGELVITTAAGTSAAGAIIPGVPSIDAVTVTMVDSTVAGYRAPTYVAPPLPGTSGAIALAHPIQDAIDAAAAGDLIILDAGNYSELVVMDRPVQLQGVGAAAVVINATKYPNQKTDHWRTRINNLFGLDNQGNTMPGVPAVDPLPGQEITGGIVLLEPSVLSTEEGAGITVVAKGYEADGTTVLLGKGSRDCPNLHNFRCATSRIDGLSVTGGDAGGGIYVNGWAHNLEISNNRVFGNAGPFSGGVRIGQPYLEGQALAASDSFQGFKYDQNVLIHNNAITNNGTVEGNAAAGALAAAAGGAGGGLSICAGSDGYKVTGNWICGNYTSSDGGGIGHIGLSTRGTISNNKILFNESFNQTGPQFGGGLIIEGEGGTGTTLSLGSGNVTVDSNLILGNFARAGSGGGIRLQNVNGADVRAFDNPWRITVTNNMIVNNVAAWAGAGISLADTLFSHVVGNTIVSNDSTGIAGNLFSTQVGTGNTGPTTAIPNPSGVSTEMTSQPLLAALDGDIRSSNRVSNPHLVNDVIWHNRSFFFNMAGGTPQLSPSNTWTDAVGTAPAPLGAPASGANGCVPTQEKYWDVGVVGETSAATTTMPPGNHNVLSTTAGTPNLTQPYCNASRALPGLQFEPGTPFQPHFNISVSATLDESGNFVDLHFGPLSLQDQATSTIFNGDYHLLATANSANSSTVDHGNDLAQTSPYNHDFDGDGRPGGPHFDIGADELVVKTDLTITKTDGLSTVDRGQTVVYTIVVTNNGATAVAGATVNDPAFASQLVTPVSWTCAPGTTASSCPVPSGSGPISNVAVNLAAGDHVTFLLTAKVTDSVQQAPDCSFVSNTASVTSPLGSTDIAPGNNTATDTDQITCPTADLVISKTTSTPTVVANGTVVYTLTVTNAGPGVSTGARVTDVIPAAFTQVANGLVWTCSANPIAMCGATANTGTGSINKVLGTLPVNATVTFTINAVVRDNNSVGTRITNTATVTPAVQVTDPNPANNTASVTVAVTAGGVADTVTPATIAFGTVARGSASTVRNVTVTNAGTAPLALANFVLGGAAAQYSVVAPTAGTACAAGTVLAARNAACTIGLQFTPATGTSAGAKAATLTVSSNASAKLVTLGGTAR